jgi:hypothetical protein
MDTEAEKFPQKIEDKEGIYPRFFVMKKDLKNT